AGGREILLAREGHQPANQFGTALRGVLHVVENLPFAFAELDPPFEQTQPTKNCSKQIIEIVRNAPGELAQRLGLACLNKLLGQRMLGGYVHQRADPAGFAVGPWRALIEYVYRGSVGPLPSIMENFRTARAFGDPALETGDVGLGNPV